MPDLNFSSDVYPYSRVQTGFTRFVGAERIPLQILTYLLDLPDKNGYQPVDDNSRPRVRLAKYLWYDGANPLSYSLPTPAEKRSMLFDGNTPVIDTDEQKALHPKGFRIYPLEFWEQAQKVAQTTLKCYTGRVVPFDDYHAAIGLYFTILVNYGQETTMRVDTSAKSYAIEQCIIEALHGVNITGIGTVEFSRYGHGDNGSRAIYDEGRNVGRQLHMSIMWADSVDDTTVRECGA